MISKKLLIKELRNQKKSYKEIGDILHISKQRVHQIYKNYQATDKKIRREIIERDGKKCTICNSFLKIEVHHIDGDKKNNKKSNLITLCRKCHIKVDSEDRKNIRGYSAHFYYGGVAVKKRKPLIKKIVK